MMMTKINKTVSMRWLKKHLQTRPWGRTMYGALKQAFPGAQSINVVDVLKCRKLDRETKLVLLVDDENLSRRFLSKSVREATQRSAGLYASYKHELLALKRRLDID